jgi:cyclase
MTDMTRRSFFQMSLASGLLAAGGRGGAQGAPPEATVTFTPLRRNVGLCTGRGGTIGWLITPGGVVVVDSQFPDTATKVLAGVSERTSRRIDLLVNTHHHGDHTAGNIVFKPAVDGILAHERVPALQKQAAEAQGTLDQQAYADHTYGKVWRQEIAGDTMRVEYFGPGHTSGDSVVTFEKANVAHVGDLVFRERHPFIDRPAGASVQNWIAALEAIRTAHGRDTIFIFGHAREGLGPSGTAADLVEMSRYLSGVVEAVQSGLAAGRSRDEITAATSLKGFEQYQGAPPRLTLGTVLGVTYDELTAKG